MSYSASDKPFDAEWHIMPPIPDGIIRSLRQARAAAGLSQRALAARVGLTQAHVSRIESGTVDLQVSTLAELARALGLEVRFLPRASLPLVDSLVRNLASPTDGPSPNRPLYRIEEDEDEDEDDD